MSLQTHFATQASHSRAAQDNPAQTIPDNRLNKLHCGVLSATFWRIQLARETRSTCRQTSLDESLAYSLEEAGGTPLNAPINEHAPPNRCATIPGFAFACQFWMLGAHEALRLDNHSGNILWRSTICGFLQRIRLAARLC